jgi:hypothetical protein
LATEEERIIYQQRYETFRHLDKLRWQSPAIALAGGSALLGLSKPQGASLPPWWAILVFGVLCALSSLLIIRVRSGIRANRKVLARVAEQLGDDLIPATTPWGGASWWFLIFLAGLAVASIVLACFQYPV